MKQHGFSLIELIVVIAIIAIIATIAIPSYNEYITRAKRIEATNGLQDLMRAQEDYSINELSYTTSLTDLNYNASQETYSGAYVMTASACGGGAPLTECVMLTATPQGSQAADGALTLNSRGQRTHNGNPGWPD